jgi:hypothetical protein
LNPIWSGLTNIPHSTSGIGRGSFHQLSLTGERSRHWGYMSRYNNTNGRNYLPTRKTLILGKNYFLITLAMLCFRLFDISLAGEVNGSIEHHLRKGDGAGDRHFWVLFIGQNCSFCWTTETQYYNGWFTQKPCEILEFVPEQSDTVWSDNLSRCAWLVGFPRSVSLLLEDAENTRNQFYWTFAR